ncbi:hypothetical protein [Amycolatopsis echigonensis]|uniref:Uncharacterized protein n=1 Tax=Amycolatopsis echigonensis TaxID=2576905 RepID=A0A8E1W849_9PSEU|nr:hypothetical protein [Amycolatopsis echigonensis]MBB2505250.1 hypothetical protein [Amycolatopsis echigonensis]
MPCRNANGRRRSLTVRRVPGRGVALHDQKTGELIAELDFLEVGRLRAALRAEVLAASWPAGDPN